MSRVVVGPVVVLPQSETGLLGYYYQGATLPDGLDEDRVQSAIDDGLVKEDVDLAALTIDDLSVAAAGDRFRQGGVIAPDEPAAVAAEDDADSAPPKAAAKEQWVDFAVAQGADRAEAEALTKAELIERYGA